MKKFVLLVTSLVFAASAFASTTADLYVTITVQDILEVEAVPHPGLDVALDATLQDDGDDYGPYWLFELEGTEADPTKRLVWNITSNKTFSYSLDDIQQVPGDFWGSDWWFQRGESFVDGLDGIGPINVPSGENIEVAYEFRGGVKWTVTNNFDVMWTLNVWQD